MAPVRPLLVAALAAFVLNACVGAGPDDPGPVAAAELALASTPSGVRCLVVAASGGGRSAQWGFSLTPGAPATHLALDDVPVGRVRFEASAYAADCAGDAPGNTDPPGWVASSQLVDILAGVDNPLTLVLHPRGGSVGGDVAFQTPVVSVALAEHTSFAVLANGDLYGWGDNSKGQMGDNVGTLRTRPTLVAGFPGGATQVAAGKEHACALVGADGSVWCWGAALNGQVGGGDSVSRKPVTRVTLPAGTRALKIAAGDSHSCALLNNGTVSCWGSHTSTLNPAAMQLVPSPGHANVAALGPYVDVVASMNVTCALDGLGKAECWALVQAGAGPADLFQNEDGEGPGAMVGFDSNPGTRLGVRADGEVYTWTRSGAMLPTDPVQITGITDGVEAAISATNACVLRATGAVRCWGASATHGEIGDGSGEASATPVAVIGLTSAIHVAAGNRRSCAITEEGSLYCWGENLRGELGLGDRADRYLPARVSF